MSLLELESVSRVRRNRRGAWTVLREVSLELEQGEVVAVWGVRRSGRSTLLRIAAGIERPDEGTVRFAGSDLRSREGRTAGNTIGYCQREVGCVEAGTVVDELVVSQLARGVALSAAQIRARETLERVGAGECGDYTLRELDSEEAARTMIARALVANPRLIVADEPTKGMDLGERERIMALLCSLADEGRAVLLSTGESTALSRADRAVTLSDGELHGSVAPELAAVLPLRRLAGA